MPSNTVCTLRCQLWQDVMRLWQIQVYPERYAGLDRARLCEEIQQGIEVRIAVLEGLEMAEEEMM